MVKDKQRGEVWIRRSDDRVECDVIVAIRGKEIVVRLPDYDQAVKWARMESRSYNVAIRSS